MRTAVRNLCALGFVWVLLGGVGSQSGQAISGSVPQESPQPFMIAGSTTEPLSPGVMAPLDLTFTNPMDVPMSVGELSIRVRDVSAPNADDRHPCGPSDFAVTEMSRDLVITLGAGVTTKLSDLDVPRPGWPQVGMLDRPVNQDGCKGAHLTLEYTGAGKSET